MTKCTRSELAHIRAPLTESQEYAQTIVYPQSVLSGQFAIGVIPRGALFPVHACLVVFELAFPSQ